jgi:hypothetical protein
MSKNPFFSSAPKVVAGSGNKCDFDGSSDDDYFPPAKVTGSSRATAFSSKTDVEVKVGQQSDVPKGRTTVSFVRHRAPRTEDMAAKLQGMQEKYDALEDQFATYESRCLKAAAKLQEKLEQLKLTQDQLVDVFDCIQDCGFPFVGPEEPSAENQEDGQGTAHQNVRRV